MTTFNEWRQKQKLYNSLYSEVLHKKEKEQQWKNKELSFNKRYKLWLKDFSAFYGKRVAFSQKLEEEIFKNNKLLSVEEALTFF